MPLRARPVTGEARRRTRPGPSLPIPLGLALLVSLGCASGPAVDAPARPTAPVPSTVPDADVAIPPDPIPGEGVADPAPTPPGGALDTPADGTVATAPVPAVEPARGDPPTAPAARRPLPAPARPARIGRLADPGLVETSGLAASPADGRVLWAVNDSGAGPVLHALDLTGGYLGRVRIDAPARDWEDLAAATLAGVPTLVVAETGDNLRRRDAATLYLVAEPDLPDPPGDAAGSAPYAALAFGYEDGPQDVESVAHADGAFWLLSKAPPRGGATTPAGVYRLDASPETIDAAIDARARGLEPPPAVARRVATMRTRPASLAATLALAVAGVDLNHPTALDIDEARGIAWVLTYREVLRFDRRGDEPWGDTLARPGRRVHAHDLAQAEALAATPSGLVVLTSEGRGAPVVGLVGR